MAAPDEVLAGVVLLLLLLEQAAAVSTKAVPTVAATAIRADLLWWMYGNVSLQYG